MSETNTQLAEQEKKPATVKAWLEVPNVKARFDAILGPQRAPRFMAALISISQQTHLAKCEPKSVIASAIVAATLDLPIEKSLGFAHIVPYAGKAQFQMAAKGYIQLALRSGQYQRLNAKAVNKEAFGGFDEVGEPKIDWGQLNEEGEIVGYVVAWKLINGFTKIAYWPKTKVEAHAQKFSQAYQKKKADSPWFTNFDKMAIKTVVMNELRAWGILSVEMQTALKHDMGVQADIDDEVQFVDNDGPTDGEDAQPAEGQVTKRSDPPARSKTPKGAGAIDVTATTVAESTKTDQKTETKAETVATPPAEDKKVAPPAEEKKVTPPQVEKKIEPPVTPPAPATPPVAEKTVVPGAPQPAADTPKPRPGVRTLWDVKEGETVVALCKIGTVRAMMAGLAGVVTPVAHVEVTGQFEGKVYHFGGATKREEGVVANPPWEEGKTLKITLHGHVNKKTNLIIAMVDKVEIAEEAPAAPQSEDIG